MSRRKSSLLATIVAICAILVPAASRASVITKTDGNDTPGPLDLAKVRVSHVSKTTDAILIRTIGPFTNPDIDGKKGDFALAFSWDGGRHVQRIAYVFYAKGALRGVLVDSFGSFEGNLHVARAGGRGVVVQLRHGDMADHSYRLVVASVWREAPCAKRCIDWVPNRGSLLHDIMPPSVKRLRLPRTMDGFASVSGDVVSFPVTFLVADDKFGSGIRNWRLQRKQGAAPWGTIAIGHALSPTVVAKGTQGETYQFRVLVTDRQGNRTTSAAETIAVPVDDTFLAVSYDASWTPSGSAGFLLATVTHGDLDGQLSFTFHGARLCFLPGPTSGPAATASYLIVPTSTGTGGSAGTINESAITKTGYAGAQCILGDARNTWTLTLTVTSPEPFVVDGFIVFQNRQ